ncbi:MAG: pyrroline-5-carboxylate reductase [Phycisphaerales bacterium]|nr:pyrroline-5-carboxylate reductase [Phycisphaerales bacterium]
MPHDPQEQYLPPLVIGGGNMARAIVQGARRRGVERFRGGWLAEPDMGKHAGFREAGMATFGSAAEAAAGIAAGDATLPIILAIKPQMLSDAVSGLAEKLGGRRTLVVSILAGTPISRIRELFAGHERIVRVMPNLAASIGEGATAISAATAVAADVELVREIFEAVGPLVVELDESLMDAFTALAGSGPAYVFFLAEAMAKAGEAIGFDAQTALAITRQTIAGAAQLLAGSAEDPDRLRAAVTSKGGTTAAASGVLESRGVMQAWVDAIIAARDRGRELSKL